MSYGGSRPPDIDLGDGARLWFVGWHPDRALNPHHEGIPDVERFGAILEFADGCTGSITFDTPEVVAVLSASEQWRDRNMARPRWTVESWDPLTLSPSILDHADGNHEHHGYIRQGRWEEC